MTENATNNQPRAKCPDCAGKGYIVVNGSYGTPEREECEGCNGRGTCKGTESLLGTPIPQPTDLAATMLAITEAAYPGSTKGIAKPATPHRTDDPALTWAKILAMTPSAEGLAIRSAIRAHIGNILSRLSNEAQAQLLVAEAWAQEADRAYDGTDALEQHNLAAGRAAALAWVQGALGSACDMTTVAVPFEVPHHWNQMPPEPEEESDDCPTCGGSGGGDEAHLRCHECNGTGRNRFKSEEELDGEADDAYSRWKDERAEREFHAQGAEQREVSP